MEHANDNSFDAMLENCREMFRKLTKNTDSLINDFQDMNVDLKAQNEILESLINGMGKVQS